MGSETARGGVAIYVNDKLKVKERNDLNESNRLYEAIWIEIINKKTKNTLICCSYRHPKSDIDEYISYMNKCYEKINKEKKVCFIAGDFNIDLLKTDSNSKISEFVNLTTSNGFLPYITQPTRITETSATVIDNIFSNYINHDNISGNIFLQFADHLCQFITIDKTNDKIKIKDSFRRDYANFFED